jgi:hypothetical protein
MRRPIETVPKDGKPVILEDDTNGTYELAQWSAQEGAWVGENGKPCKMIPTHWHTVQRAEHLGGDYNSTSLSQGGTMFPNSGAEPRRTPASTDVFVRPPMAASSELVKFAGLDNQVPGKKAHHSQARRRFAAACGAAMVAVSLTGMYFRGDVAAYAAKRAGLSDGLGIASAPEGSLMDQPRKISLAATPPQAEADTGTMPASAGPVTVGRAPTQSPENRRADAMENELHNARQALAEAQERETLLKQTAETTRTELQQALDKIASLENELALVRQHVDQASPSPRRGRRIAQRRLKQPTPPGFFGIFGVPNRAPSQSFARTR